MGLKARGKDFTLLYPRRKFLRRCRKTVSDGGEVWCAARLFQRLAAEIGKQWDKIHGQWDIIGLIFAWFEKPVSSWKHAFPLRGQNDIDAMSDGPGLRSMSIKIISHTGTAKPTNSHISASWVCKLFGILWARCTSLGVQVDRRLGTDRQTDGRGATLYARPAREGCIINGTETGVGLMPQYVPLPRSWVQCQNNFCKSNIFDSLSSLLKLSLNHSPSSTVTVHSF